MPEIPSTTPTLGQVLRTARAELGISLLELSRRTGLSKALISKAERDQCTTPPSEVVLQCLGGKLGLNGDRLCLLAGRLPARWQELLARNSERFVLLFLSFENGVEPPPGLIESDLVAPCQKTGNNCEQMNTSDCIELLNIAARTFRDYKSRVESQERESRERSRQMALYVMAEKEKRRSAIDTKKNKKEFNDV